MCAVAVLSDTPAETQATELDHVRRLTRLDFDPFFPPSQRTHLVDVRARARVAVCIEEGRRLVAGGMVFSRRGRLLLLNPFVRLVAAESADDISAD